MLGREQLNTFNCWTQLAVHKHLQPVITKPPDFPPPEKTELLPVETDDIQREAMPAQGLRNTDLQECMTTFKPKRLQEILPQP